MGEGTFDLFIRFDCTLKLIAGRAQHPLIAYVCHGLTESGKATKPRLKFFGASDDEDSEEELQDDNQSAVKFADKPLKSKPKAMFADTGRPKVREFEGNCESFVPHQIIIYV